MTKRSNSYFHCKQFTIHQEHCAMKVGTDGMVLGAWVAVRDVQRILDVGTGTGLVALMLAQRSSAQIDAIEIDGNAVLQAQENVAGSPWSDRIQVHHSSIQDYAAKGDRRYDLLVTNPPFFSNSSPSTRGNRAIARHSNTLPSADLLQVATQLLEPSGRLAVIYPPDTAQVFESAATAMGWLCNRKLYLQPRRDHPVKRIVMEFSQTPLPCQASTLLIYSTETRYTADYIALMRDFYLKY